MKNICVFCSSSNYVNSVFAEAANELGAQLAANRFAVVYGGTHIGLMGKLARSAKAAGGRAIGVIPEKLRDRGLAWDELDELFVTADMRERKAKMGELAEGFIALPGGFGTLEEVFEVITLKQLGYHNKAIVLLNIADFYQHLLNQFELFYKEKFAAAATADLFFVADTVESAIAYLKSYRPGYIPDKVLHK